MNKESEQSINRKMVEAALILKQINGETVQQVPHDVKLKHVYCASFKDNVIRGIDPESYCGDIIRGDGGELCNPSGSTPKFNSISSSAALAVSTFAPWKQRIDQLVIDLGSNRISGFDRIEFEHIAQTAIPKAKKHPNLDVWLETSDGVLAIECKFCEYLNDGSEKHNLHPAYKRVANEMRMISPWVDVIDKITNSSGDCKYKFFDAAQIIRHYFGMINSVQKEKHLLYLYWHPENEDWLNIHPFDMHMIELMEFSELVSKATDVHFHYMRFNELWDKWSLSKNLEVQDHLKSLKQKYSIIIKLRNER